MIRKFTCKNFRNIDVNDLELARINILIGPNNSGKTNFIRALTFYSNMLKHENEGLQNTDFLNAMERNGWSHSKRFDAKKEDKVSFEWLMDYLDEPIDYKFAYNVGDNLEDYYVSLEEMSSAIKDAKHNNTYNYFRAHKYKVGNGNFSTATRKGSENKRISVSVNCTKTIISQFEKLLLEDSNLYNSKVVRNDLSLFIKDLEKTMKSFYFYSSAGLNTKYIRKSADKMMQERFLRNDGINYANIFSLYKAESLLWKHDYVEKMKLLLRNLVDVDVIEQRNQLSVHLIEKDKELDLTDVSEGTIKALIWGLLLCTPEKYSYDLLALDEIECNLHPAWQKVFADIIIESSSYKQCIISTHSPELLDGFTDMFKNSDELAVFSFDTQGNVRKIKYDDIYEDIGNWSLGELYRTQDPALGGWPW